MLKLKDKCVTFRSCFGGGKRVSTSPEFSPGLSGILQQDEIDKIVDATNDRNALIACTEGSTQLAEAASKKLFSNLKISRQEDYDDLEESLKKVSTSLPHVATYIQTLDLSCFSYCSEVIEEKFMFQNLNTHAEQNSLRVLKLLSDSWQYFGFELKTVLIRIMIKSPELRSVSMDVCTSTFPPSLKSSFREALAKLHSLKFCERKPIKLGLLKGTEDSGWSQIPLAEVLNMNTGTDSCKSLIQRLHVKGEAAKMLAGILDYPSSPMQMPHLSKLRIDGANESMGFAVTTILKLTDHHTIKSFGWCPFPLWYLFDRESRSESENDFQSFEQSETKEHHPLSLSLIFGNDFRIDKVFSVLRSKLGIRTDEVEELILGCSSNFSIPNVKQRTENAEKYRYLPDFLDFQVPLMLQDIKMLFQQLDSDFSEVLKVAEFPKLQNIYLWIAFRNGHQDYWSKVGEKQPNVWIPEKEWISSDDWSLIRDSDCLPTVRSAGKLSLRLPGVIYPARLMDLMNPDLTVL